MTKYDRERAEFSLIKQDMMLLIDDEELALEEGGATPWITATIGVAGLLGITSACTSRCWRP